MGLRSYLAGKPFFVKGSTSLSTDLARVRGGIYPLENRHTADVSLSISKARTLGRYTYQRSIRQNFNAVAFTDIRHAMQRTCVNERELIA